MIAGLNQIEANLIFGFSFGFSKFYFKKTNKQPK